MVAVRISIAAEDPSKVADLCAWISKARVEGATVELSDAVPDGKQLGAARTISAVLGPAGVVPLVLAIRDWIIERAPEVEAEVEVDDMKLKVKARNTEKVVRRVERWIRGN